MTTHSPLSSINILMVDDEEFSSRFISRILQNIGVGNVILADNAIDALDLLARGEIPIDLVVSDIKMPGKDRFALSRQIRSGFAPQYKDVPILVMSGYGSEESRQKSDLHRVEGYMEKPPKPDRLKEKIEQALSLAG